MIDKEKFNSKIIGLRSVLSRATVTPTTVRGGVYVVLTAKAIYYNNNHIYKDISY